MDNRLVVFFGERRRARPSSPDNIPAVARTRSTRRGGYCTVKARRRLATRSSSACRARLSLINPSRPCSQPSFEGSSHHSVSRFVHVLPPLLPIRRRRRRRQQQRKNPLNHQHPQNFTRASKRLRTSCQSIFKPPSCSYRTFLVRHPAASCSHPRTFYIHGLLWE